MRAGRSSGGHRCTAGLAALAACDLDSILDVEDPNKATQEDIEDPNNLPGVRAHAVGEFQVGYAGRGEAQDNAFVLMSGLLADEYEASGTFPTRVEVDRRDILTTNSTAQGTFRLMHRARAAALLSYEAHELHEPGTRPQSEAAMLAGFMYNAFGEMYCSGVPSAGCRSERIRCTASRSPCPRCSRRPSSGSTTLRRLPGRPPQSWRNRGRPSGGPARS